jgi:hypothetical protein
MQAKFKWLERQNRRLHLFALCDLAWQSIWTHDLVIGSFLVCEKSVRGIWDAESWNRC